MGSDEARRIVMLVDNGVNGDSRVQKEARSAAEAGWDVTLLGRSPDDKEHTWMLGPAQVRLVPVPFHLDKRPHEFRRRWVMAPLAYPQNGVAEQRGQWVKAWRANLTMDRLVSPGGAREISRKVQWQASRVVNKWVSVRQRQTKKAARARKTLDTPSDKLYTWFWSTVQGPRAWRRLEPQLWDWELAFGPVLDRVKPDLIHANDFRMLGVGARAKIRAKTRGRDVKLVWDAHEFLPGVRPWTNHARWRTAQMLHEAEYVPYVDAAMTVSDDLAGMLQEAHRLPERPAVVLNTPAAEHAPADAAGTPLPDLRELCGIGPDTPLIVYSGAASIQRGLAVMVEGLARQPGVHLALVTNNHSSGYMGGLRKRATALGISDRVHFLPYVPHWQVVPFLAAATVGVIPIFHFPNHEIALITKFFEYSHARLPLVVSDVRTMASTVRATGQGEVFTSTGTPETQAPPADVDAYVQAVQKVLDDPERYRAAYDKPGLLDGWTWDAQARVMNDVYRRLLPEA
ncbi:glycosyl transferase family 1 [Actinoplanes sp. SE50]|uniref:glycosyltransferase family 4 protein n=1 Tax=unclassified Actinoplanes TaxID=2626549 RepID=UPI00023EDD88|nr:Glycogen synthase [Actinoplanes sp. SE50/110]ATO87030.1 glycosyl transferase family 1 [Actinoplanes sp. SE50]SLM04448.1 glycosyl transferase family 1 [Actinoplanes sp. SE50/110]